jgi:hypothetical protein
MFSLVLYVSVPVLLFRIPTVFDLLPIESVRFRIYCYPASSFSFLFPTFPNSISFPYSNVKVKTILGLSRPSSTAFNPIRNTEVTMTFFFSFFLLILFYSDVLFQF